MMALVLSLLVLLVCVSAPVSGQTYYTATISSSLPFSTTPVLAQPTVEPVCVVDYTSVWAKNSSYSLMMATGGGANYGQYNRLTTYSTDGFQTSTNLFNTSTGGHRGGGAVWLYNGSRLYLWSGLGGDDIATGGVCGSTNFLSTCTGALAAGSPPVIMWRFAWAVMPYMNYIVQVGGVDEANFTTTYNGGNAVWVSPNGGSSWSQQPYPPFGPFISGNLVALYDGASVPGVTATQTYSTLVLLAPGTPAAPSTSVWASTDGAKSWIRQTAAAPWLTNADWGNRRSASATVDADNYIYFMGGNTATADLYLSTTKGSTWSLVAISAGTSGTSYAGSFSSCLAVRYTSSGAKTLVLYSGQIYSSLATAGTPLSLPAPSVYALTFALTSTTTAPSTTPLPVNYPGTAPTQYYFHLSYSGSAIVNSQGLPYTVCVNAILNTPGHPGWGDTSTALPYIKVSGASGTRTLVNTTGFFVQQITGVQFTDFDTYFSNNFIYPNISAVIDDYGISFTLDKPAIYSSPPFPNNYPFPFATGSQDIYNYVTYSNTNYASATWVNTNTWTEEPTPDGAALGIGINLTAVTAGSTNPYPACSTTLLPVPVLVPSTVPLPRVIGTGSLSATSLIYSGAAIVTQASIYGTNFTTPYLVYLYDANGLAGPCTNPVRSTCTNNTCAAPYTAASQIISCFPSFPLGTSPNLASWVSIKVVTVSGSSNVFPGWLFRCPNNPDFPTCSNADGSSNNPWPPVIYNVTGSSCVPVSSALQINYGPNAVMCPQYSTLTIAGDFFTATNLAITVGGQACQGTKFINSTYATCYTNLPSTTSFGYAMQLSCGGLTSNQMPGLFLSPGANTQTGGAAGTHGNLQILVISSMVALCATLVLLW